MKRRMRRQEQLKSKHIGEMTWPGGIGINDDGMRRCDEISLQPAWRAESICSGSTSNIVTAELVFAVLVGIRPGVELIEVILAACFRNELSLLISTHRLSDQESKMGLLPRFELDFLWRVAAAYHHAPNQKFLDLGLHSDPQLKHNIPMSNVQGYATWVYNLTGDSERLWGRSTLVHYSTSYWCTSTNTCFAYKAATTETCQRHRRKSDILRSRFWLYRLGSFNIFLSFIKEIC